MSKLKPCKRCGGKPRMISTNPNSYSFISTKYLVKCTNRKCGFHTKNTWTRKEAADEWDKFVNKEKGK